MLALQRESVKHKLQSAKATSDAAAVVGRADQFLKALVVDILENELITKIEDHFLHFRGTMFYMLSREKPED